MAPNFLALTLSLLLWPGHSFAALRSYDFTVHQGTRAPGEGLALVRPGCCLTDNYTDGVTREVYLINGQQPGPLIEVEEGDDLEVFVKNELPAETTIHWHGEDANDNRPATGEQEVAGGHFYLADADLSRSGLLQRGTPEMDGVPGVSQFPIAPGGNFTYKFSVGNEYGFYWYHSHFRAYYNDAVRGPLMIHPSPSRTRPFESLASSGAEKNMLLQAERNASSVLLNDWTHSVSDAVYAQYFETGAYPFCVDSLLANGYGRVQCLPESILQAGTGLGLGSSSSRVGSTSTIEVSTSMAKRMDGSSGNTDTAMQTMTAGDSSTSPMMPMSTVAMVSMTSMSSMPSMSGMSGMSGTSGNSASSPPSTSLTPRGCTPPKMFRPGFNASSLPPDTCTNTTSPLLTIPANYTQGWLALNLVNSGAVSQLGVSLDAHSMFVYAADGLFVELQQLKVLYIAVGQRYSVMIKLDQKPGNYYLRFASYPGGDMQQVIEGQAIVSYSSLILPFFDRLKAMRPDLDQLTSPKSS
ncbi:hypothetical protein LTR28_003965 [Elasticomyces elasticus]|nr:hypothetical protein LTR28_003965 [Elasticomyces elasticus]